MHSVLGVILSCCATRQQVPRLVFDDDEVLTRRRIPVVRWSSQMTVFSTRTSQWGEEQNLVTMMRMRVMMISTNTPHHDWQVFSIVGGETV